MSLPIVFWLFRYAILARHAQPYAQHNCRPLHTIYCFNLIK